MTVTHRLITAEFGSIRRELREMTADEAARITSDQAEAVSSAANTVRKTLLAEAAGLEAFLVTQKRYPVKRLLDDVPNLMAPGVYDQLPDMAQQDFSAAGRCIAFELPTSAAFHLMRGTESVLRHFYVQVVKRNRIKPPYMWGPMVASLRARRTAPPNELLDNLDQLRRNFRNPTQHPDKVYDVDEAQDLLSLSIDVVNRMIRHIE